jgi:hypothetical protein
MIKKGLINPKSSDLLKINDLLRQKGSNSTFHRIFERMLLRQVRFLLKNSVKKQKFINCINFIFSRTSRYAVDRIELKLKIGKLVHRYDDVIKKRISLYDSHKAYPVADLIENICELKRYNPDLLFLSLKQARFNLIRLIAEPLMQDNISEFALPTKRILRLERLLSIRESLFLSHLVQFKLTA